MKSLGTCLESLLDDDDVFYDPANDKKVIEEWIMKHYTITGRLIISNDFEVSCTGRVSVKDKSITSLTNGMFGWGEISSSFICSRCENLTSLEGAPEEVGRGFDCAYCSNLKSLEGAPKSVGGNFWCDHCYSLKTLEGAPEEVGNSFFCSECISLISLKGAPKIVGGGFYCNHCENLKSLKGAPKKIGGSFGCSDCPNLKITASDREKYKIEN